MQKICFLAEKMKPWDQNNHITKIPVNSSRFTLWHVHVQVTVLANLVWFAVTRLEISLDLRTCLYLWTFLYLWTPPSFYLMTFLNQMTLHNDLNATGASFLQMCKTIQKSASWNNLQMIADVFLDILVLALSYPSLHSKMRNKLNVRPNFIHLVLFMQSNGQEI